MREIEETLYNLYGERGRKWFAHVPHIIKQIQRLHNLSHLTPVKTMHHHYVLSGFQGLKPIILKLGPDVRSLEREGAALKALQGYGVVQLVAQDKGMLLLERALPGSTLKTYFPAKENDALKIVSTIMTSLHKAPLPPDHTFPHVRDWLFKLDQVWDIPEKHLQKACRLRDRLLATSCHDRLLHGDLHHDNCVQHSDRWLAIDPKGVIGDPVYEVGAFIRNPLPELLEYKDMQRVVDERIDFFSLRLKVPTQRIIAWSYVQAVLAWIWSLEDTCPDPCFQTLTEFFDHYYEGSCR